MTENSTNPHLKERARLDLEMLESLSTHIKLEVNPFSKRNSPALISKNSQYESDHILLNVTLPVFFLRDSRGISDVFTNGLLLLPFKYLKP